MLRKGVNIKIRNVNIERVSVTKFLVAFIDDLLNWNTHIKHVQSKLSKSAAIMHRCSHLLDRNGMCILYHSHFALFKLLCRNLGKRIRQILIVFSYYKKQSSALCMVQNGWIIQTHFSNNYKYSVFVY